MVYELTEIDNCYLAAQAVASGIGVASFDKDFAKFTDVTGRKYRGLIPQECAGLPAALSLFFMREMFPA